MIGVDTNVLVCVCLEDHPQESKIAQAFLKQLGK